MSTAAIKSLLRARFPVKEWALAFEVSNGTGSQAGRHADAVAMNLWPSRGLAIHGFEFKVSRGDWLRELKQPEKAEAVAQYCDHWWIVTTEGIVKEGELPPTWGLIELQYDLTRVPKLVTIKQAPEKDSVPAGRPFMAALFRKLSEVDNAEVEQAVSKRIAELDAGRRERIEQEVKSRTHQFESLRERVEKFERASGIDLEDWMLQPEEFGKAVKFVLNCEIFRAYGSVETLHKSLVDVAGVIGKVIECRDSGTEYVREEPAIRRRKRAGVANG